MRIRIGWRRHGELDSCPDSRVKRLAKPTYLGSYPFPDVVPMSMWATPERRGAIRKRCPHAHRQRLRRHGWARQALTRIGAFFAELRQTAEQLTPLDRWYRILSLALVKYLHGRQLEPPKRIRRTETTAMD